jgi:signal transduction histidine kinase
MQDDANSATADFVFDLPHLSRYFGEFSPQPMLAAEGVNHVVRHVNAAFLRLVGANRADLVGQPFVRAVPEGAANRCIPLLDRVFQSGIAENLAEQRHGEMPPVYWSYAVWAILGNNRRPAGVIIQVADATETAVFREQSVAMNKSLLLSALRLHELTEESEELSASLKSAIVDKQYFIAVLSHELRTPLTPVLLAASLLQQDRHLSSETRGVMQMIHRNVTQEARLIDDLLDMTRMEHGNLQLDRRPIDLREVVDRAVAGCEAELEAGKLTMKLETGNGAQIVEADADRLQQVFSNLLRNAIKFTPPGGHVHVHTYCNGYSCAVEVCDSGAGIDAEFLPRAFSAFEQGDKSPSRKPGLGLGLAICKTIVELHGGAISAHSEGKGKGATFKVTLPAMLGAPRVEAEVVAPEQQYPRPLKPARILLVEDHEDTARVMRQLLTADGHTVQWADDVATALELAAAHEFDVVVSDLGLPDGTGVDMMNALRARGSTLQGIVLSGYGQDTDIARSLEAGFAAHLVKPLNSERLREAIAALVL